MDPRKKIKYGLGCLIADCFLILEAIIDIYSGNLTPTELFLQLALCAILTVLVIALLKRYVRKNK